MVSRNIVRVLACPAQVRNKLTNIMGATGKPRFTLTVVAKTVCMVTVVPVYGGASE